MLGCVGVATPGAFGAVVVFGAVVGVTPPAGLAVVGLVGPTAVPAGETVWPGTVTPPAGTGGPTGTLGAPGSDDVGDCAIGDGVVKDGTFRDAGGTPTVSADDPTVFSGDAGAVPSADDVAAPAVPDGGGVSEVGDVPGATTVGVGDGVPGVVPASPGAVPGTATG